MDNSNNKKNVWIPLIAAMSVVVGIFIGSVMQQGRSSFGVVDRKLNTILNIVGSQYVDTVDLNNLVEMTIPKMLTNLDPHTAYIPAEDLKSVNSELEGSFSGIGITFSMMGDTVTIGEIIAGGPAEKVGLKNGDRIISVNDTSIVGMKQNDVLKRIRGEKYTTVKVAIRRTGSNKIYTYTITRDDIPLNTLDVAYMIGSDIGYVKMNKFGKTSYSEFLSALLDLRTQGATRYIIDLRGNGGGLMESAIQMVNEFLPKDNLIVFTKGRDSRDNMQFWSDGTGSFTDCELAVLVDDATASSSEIFSGAIQDNDRGLIIGRRTYGKGLIQHQITLPDSSALRLTVGRYYTPAGRCIQKDFKPGADEEYTMEIYDRYMHGELYSKDSIKVNTDQIFHTTTGREVYGGGGIIPDIFVPNDTSGISSYYISVANAGLLHKFAFNFADKYRNQLQTAKTGDALLAMLPGNDALLGEFVTYASKNGVPTRWYYVNQSRQLLLSTIRALIVREILGTHAFYEVYNRGDNNIEAALKAFKAHKTAFPIKDDVDAKN